jgi:hypothetical protein
MLQRRTSTCQIIITALRLGFHHSKTGIISFPIALLLLGVVTSSTRLGHPKGKQTYSIHKTINCGSLGILDLIILSSGPEALFIDARRSSRKNWHGLSLELIASR